MIGAPTGSAGRMFERRRGVRGERELGRARYLRGQGAR